MSRRGSGIALAVLVWAGVLAGCATPAPDAPPVGSDGDADDGDDASSAPRGPDWSFADTTGATHSRDAPARNASVLFFMATWCGSCRQTAPMLASVEADYEARGVR